MQLRRSWRPLRALAAALLALGGACGESTAAPERELPPDTVLTVAGAPITTAEVDATVARIRLIYPKRSREFLITAALESFLLPQAALRHAYADERARAEAACAEAWAEIQAGGAPDALERTGGFDELTLFLWAAARELAPGEWSGPLERMGAFSIVQLVARQGYELRESEEVLTLRVVEFGYLPPDFDPPMLQAALARARLEVVEPAYDDLVPETLRYQMTGSSKP